MCGICGFTGNLDNREDVLRRMTDVITHRGPDSDGYYTDENINMGFRRLSIIDLETGHQPIFNEDKTLVLTFNGEIYNYKDLRKALIERGHRFATEADSEVLIHGFEEWGEDMLPKLRGMFGFAIYNTQDKSLFIARDFFGIKPMHYTQIDGDFVYASEIKSILEHPKFVKRFNMRALDTYLSYQYAVPPETFFEDVYCLLPGHYLWYKNGDVETTRYFEPRFRPDETMSEAEAVDKIEKVFEDSVNAHKIADVEVGCFLSSGVDSSYVSTYFADQKTFTVGFDYGEKYNEISWAKGLSEQIGVEHHTHLISGEEFWDAVPTVQYYMDQPLADPSCIALYFVSRLASHYVKVVLSGEGADELFGGYTCYNDPRVFRMYQKIVPHCIRKALRALARKLPDIKGRDYIIRACDPLEQRYIGNAFMYDYKEKCNILKDPSIATEPQRYARKHYYRCRRYDDVTKMQYLDMNMWMVGDILLKADRMSMANSLELRVPFLDKEVFKVASSLPTELRCNKSNTKYAMRKAAARHLPEATAEKEKLGFPVPTRVWLRDEKYYNIVKKKFQGKTAQKFFNTDALVAWLDEHFSGREDNSRRVWTVYVFLVWYDIYFDENDPKVEKPVNHLDELKAVAEARREKQLDAPGEVIMAAAESVDENYVVPDFADAEAVEGEQPEAVEEAPVEEAPVGETPAEVTLAEEAVAEEAPVAEQSAEAITLEEAFFGDTPEEEAPAEETPAEELTAEEPAEEAPADPVSDGHEPAIVESAEEETSAPEAPSEGFVNIQNPEDTEIYRSPRKPQTPQEQLEMALESIEKRSKYLDEPNVISDEAVDNIVSQISFFDDTDDEE
ncbi:MAG: asparagine synthase (glutamine-hydrolyzing) [Ruminococcus sp.]|nr:asparagine synthase (glutamine-hydrolyzing) [Ruminococcus sp.]